MKGVVQNMGNIANAKMWIKNSYLWGLLKKGKNKWKHYQSRISPKGLDALRLLYAQYYEECKVNDNMILYEAYAGRGIICSPYAIFKMFRKRPDFAKFTHIWVVETEQQQQELKESCNDSNVEFVVRDTPLYCRYLCTAKFLINNLSFPTYYTKKNKQIYINTWHGIPLKTLGFDIPEGRITGLNTIRNFLCVDVFLSPNHFMTERFREAFLLEGISEGRVMESGMPRNDNLFHTCKNNIIETLRKAGVKLDEKKKIILYAPTWKGEKYSSPDTSTELYFRLMEELEKHIDMQEYQILVKPHQIVYKHIVKKGEKLTDKFIPATVDTNEVLSIVDVLISDYSSIYFDYLASRKPILFYIPDLRDYQKQRGLYFGIDKLPGPVAENLQELGGLLEDIPTATEPFKEKYEQERQWACGNDDGTVCNRVIEELIVRTNTEKLLSFHTNKKTKILAYSGDLQPGEVRNKLKKWIAVVDYDKYDVTLLVPHTATEPVLNWIKEVDQRVRVLRRTGKMAVTKEQYKLADIIEKKNIANSALDAERRRELVKICQTEVIRTVGMAKFDYAVDFSEGSIFYQNLFYSMEHTKMITIQQLENL